MSAWLLHVLCDGMLTEQGPMLSGARWLYCKLWSLWLSHVFVWLYVDMFICLSGRAWWLADLYTEWGLMSGETRCQARPDEEQGPNMWLLCMVLGILGNSLSFVVTVFMVMVSGISGSKGKGPAWLLRTHACFRIMMILGLNSNNCSSIKYF